jgi:hypothetical protein
VDNLEGCHVEILDKINSKLTKILKKLTKNLIKMTNLS